MHEYQPLDAAVFGPLKRNWQEACHNYVLKNPSKVVSKYAFSSLLAEACVFNNGKPVNSPSGEVMEGQLYHSNGTGAKPDYVRKRTS